MHGHNDIGHGAISLVLLCLVQPVNKVIRLYRAAADVDTCDACAACAAADAAAHRQACLKQGTARSTNITHRILTVKTILPIKLIALGDQRHAGM